MCTWCRPRVTDATKAMAGPAGSASCLVAGPGGAVGLAALLAGRIDTRDKNVVVVLSGGNVDADLFARLVA